MWRLDNQLVEEHIYFIDRPHSVEISTQEAMTQSLKQLEMILNKHGDNIAAMIVEPIQGKVALLCTQKNI